MADHICSPAAFPWGWVWRANWSLHPCGINRSGTELMGELRGAEGSEGWQRGVTAPSPVPSGCTGTESIAPVGLGLWVSPAPSRQAGRAEALALAPAAPGSRESSPERRASCARSPCSRLRRCSARHLAGPRGLRNKELLAELSAAPGRSLTCRYRAVAQAGLSQGLGILQLCTEGSDII